MKDNVTDCILIPCIGYFLRELCIDRDSGDFYILPGTEMSQLLGVQYNYDIYMLLKHDYNGVHNVVVNLFL